jgi:hypothetical protein
VQRGDVNRIITYADAALEVAEQTRSGFISRKLKDLQGHLVPLLGNSQIQLANQRIATLSRNF